MANATSLRDPRPDPAARIEGALDRVLTVAARRSGPPTLHEALRSAVFPGGQRLRPMLAVLAAGDDPRPQVTDAAACAIELVHCASLVHDDMPCFDDAELRRGRPTVHRVYGEALALLVGDGLIVLAFETLAGIALAADANAESARVASLVPALVTTLARAAGPTRGIVAGQAWESERAAPLGEYHRAKTASLFEAAAEMGAIASGGDRRAWAGFGDAFGRAYQAIDDLRDATGTVEELGKPVGRDAALGRPSLVRASGVSEARSRLAEQLAATRAAIPATGAHATAWFDALAARFASV